MGRERRWGIVAFTGMVAASLLTGCRGADTDREGSADSVRIASFDFDESVVVAELYAQVLEARDVPVERLVRLGSREIVQPALQQGRIDLVPEYLGSALEFVSLGRDEPTADPAATARSLQAAYHGRGVSVLDHAPGEDENGIAVTRPTAQRLGIETLSDLADVAPDLVFGGPPECGERPRCLPGLEAVYGVSFSSFEPIPAGTLVALALVGGEIDVGLLFTTDPNVDAHDLVLLRDDRLLQPAEHLVPVVRDDVVTALGADGVAALGAVTERLSTAELVRLNDRVALRGEDPAAVARDWLDAQGLVVRTAASGSDRAAQ